MLEMAGGIVLAVVILILVLASFGRISIGLSIVFLVGLVSVGVVVLLALPAESRFVILGLGGFAGAFIAFCYWTHHDKRFPLLAEKMKKYGGVKSSQEKK